MTEQESKLPDKWPEGVTLPTREEVQTAVDQASADIAAAVRKYRPSRTLKDLRENAWWHNTPIGQTKSDPK